MEERKEEGRENPPPLLLELWEAAGLEREQRGGRVVVTAYCLSSVCCGFSLSAHTHTHTHSPRPSYLYPRNIHAGGGRRLQSFSSLHTLWRHCVKESVCCDCAWLALIFLQDFPHLYLDNVGWCFQDCMLCLLSLETHLHK